MAIDFLVFICMCIFACIICYRSAKAGETVGK